MISRAAASVPSCRAFGISEVSWTVVVFVTEKSAFVYFLEASPVEDEEFVPEELL
jgi:hypothetical protein